MISKNFRSFFNELNKFAVFCLLGFTSNLTAQTPTPTPSACPANGQVTDCCILNQNNTTYNLTRDLTLFRGDRCFSLASGVHDITFDLGNHTITYDTGPVTDLANPSFELSGSGNIPDNWSLTNAPGAVRHYGRGTINSFYRFGGDYVLKFRAGDYTAAQYIESSPVRLQPNIMYGVHVLYKSNSTERQRAFIEIPQIPNACATRIVDTAGTNTSWSSVYCEFTPTAVVDANIRVGVSGGVIGTDMDFDMVELRPARLAPAISFSRIGSTNLQNIILRNGTVIQGNGKTFGATDGSPVVSFSGVIGGRVSNLKITASGTQRIGLGISYSNNVEVDGNEIRALGTYGRKRDQLLAMISAHYLNDGLSIHDNAIYPYQTGIKFVGANNSIFNNNIQMNSYLTNGYAISVRDDPRGDSTNSRIFGNTITGIGRGMHITPSSGLEIYGNQIDLMEYPNPEFWDWQRYDSGHCVHGLKFEEEVINARVHHNYVRASQVNGTYGGCALNMNLSQPAGFVSNTVLEDNEFVNETYDTSKLTGAAVPAYLIEIEDPLNLTFRRNRFASNSRGTFYLDTVSGIDFNDSQFDYTGPSGLEHFFMHNTHGGNLSRVSDVGFYNTSVTNMNLARPHSAGGGAWNYFVGWNLAVRVQNEQSQQLAGANVVVTRVSDGSQVFSGVSDGTGYARVPLAQYEIAGTGSVYNQTSKSPYSISVTLQGSNQARQVDLNGNKEETFTFVGGVPGDISPPGAPQGLTVQ